MGTNDRGLIAWDVPGDPVKTLTLEGSLHTAKTKTVLGVTTVVETTIAPFSVDAVLTPALFPWTEADPGFIVSSDSEIYTMQWLINPGTRTPGTTGYRLTPIQFNSCTYDILARSFGSTSITLPQLDRVVNLAVVAGVDHRLTITTVTTVSGTPTTTTGKFELNGEATASAPSGIRFWTLKIFSPDFPTIKLSDPNGVGPPDYTLTEFDFDLSPAGDPIPPGTYSWIWELTDAPPDAPYTYTAFDVTFTVTVY